MKKKLETETNRWREGRKSRRMMQTEMEIDKMMEKECEENENEKKQQQ